MPITYWTVPDSSPWINYQGTWVDESDGNQTAGYVNSSYHYTQAADAAAIITFNGTGAALYGAKRSNHGNYVVGVDSSTSIFSGFATNPELFNQTLFNVTKLPPASHTIAFTNPTASIYLDLDYAVLEVGDGNPNTSSTDVWIDDTHLNVTYDPTWGDSVNPQIQDQYFNLTFHSTNISNSSMTIQFSGHQIAVYGATWFNHGPYSVSLDGMLPQTYINRATSQFRAQQLLYFASSLSNGTHSVVLTNDVDDFYLDFDYAIATTYWAVVEPSSSSPSPSSSPNPSSFPLPSSTNSAPTPHPSRSSTPVAAIAGGVVGGFVVLSIIAILLFLVYHQWKKNHSLGMNHAGSGAPAMAAMTLGAMRHPYAPEVEEPYYGMAASTGSSDAPLFTPRGGNEIDMPPPNYDHVYPQAGRPTGGSQAGASSPRSLAPMSTRTKVG